MTASQGTGTPPHHGHHSHHGAEEPDWEAMADALVREARLNSSAVRESTRWLRELLGPRADEVARVLDVGSGPGVNSVLLAQAFPAAETVAVDATAPLLERAQRYAEAEGLVDRFRTLHAQLPEDFPLLGGADLIWTSHVVHHLGDQQAALTALGESLRPGGLLAVIERGLPLRFLPRDIGIGRPGLLPRLEAAREKWFADMRAGLPGSTEIVEHWPGLLAAAGLRFTGSRTFLVEEPTPLSQEAREQLYDVLARTRATHEEGLDSDDLATLDRLLDRDAPEGVLNRPDVYYLLGTTVHTATRPAH